MPLALTMPPSKVRPQCVKLCTNKAANVSFEPKEEAEHTPIIIGACAIYTAPHTRVYLHMRYAQTAPRVLHFSAFHIVGERE